MIIRCYGDDIAVFVDDFHVRPPIQRALSAAAMVRNLSNLLRALGVPSHEDHSGGHLRLLKLRRDVWKGAALMHEGTQPLRQRLSSEFRSIETIH